MSPIQMSAFRYSSECHYIVETSMDKAFSAADANRRFSELLRTVRKGQSVVVTSHGKPVAKITSWRTIEPQMGRALPFSPGSEENKL